MTLIVGITGGIGSGKSAVTRRFEQHDIAVVDADLAARVVVEPGKPALGAIAEPFGRDLLSGKPVRALFVQWLTMDMKWASTPGTTTSGSPGY